MDEELCFDATEIDERVCVWNANANAAEMNTLENGNGGNAVLMPTLNASLDIARIKPRHPYMHIPPSFVSFRLLRSLNGSVKLPGWLGVDWLVALCVVCV